MELLRLKEILKERGITGKDLAAKAEVNVNTISRIVNGSSFPSGELLKKIADILEVNVRELFLPGEDVQDLYIKENDSFVKVGEIKKGRTNS